MDFNVLRKLRHDNQERLYDATGGNSEPLSFNVSIQSLHDKLEHPEQYDHDRIEDTAIRQIRGEYEP